MALTRQVEEIVLMRCSLLPDELIEFIFSRSEDLEEWTRVVDAHSKGDFVSSQVSRPAHFTAKVNDIPLWFEVEFPDAYPFETQDFNITVRGYNISRTEQQRWQDIIQEERDHLIGVEYLAYELISLHLLPRLHEEYPQHKAIVRENPRDATIDDPTEPLFHALLTSHHLKSPQKRRSLQQWSSELLLHGFAKVGHPGVIYCSGLRSNVEEFVSKVKEMQWLALRVRFIEALPDANLSESKRGSWLEVEKVSQVVGEMKKLGRERYVLELGIGSGGGGGEGASHPTHSASTSLTVRLYVNNDNC